MDWVIGLLAAMAAIYGFVAVYALLYRVRRHTEIEYGPNAFLCATLGILALTRIVAVRHDGPTPDAERHATLLIVLAVALVLHFVVDYARLAEPARRAWVRFAYVTAAALAVATMLGELHEPSRPPLVGYEFGIVALPLSRLGVVVHMALLGEIVVATWLLGRAYVRGKREALAGAMGGVALASAFALDVVHGVGFGGFAIGQLGFFAFALGASTVAMTRFVDTAGELERRTDELQSLADELRRSYNDLRAVQEELVRKEQLAVVGELAAVVAHEVRNPLAVITNAVAGLRRPTLSRDDQTTLLAILDEETRRLNRLVSDLLRYARPVNVQRAPVPLSDLLDRPLALAAKAGVDIVRAQSDGLDGRVSGDASLLRQVFDNLVENAVQAMTHGGTLTVKCEHRLDDGFDGLAISLADTGEGMDTIVRNRAKDPFFTTRPSGTGLGLAIVDRIVEAHGGHLLIESRAGEGTTVTVCLPTATPSEVGPRAQPADAGTESA